MAKRHALGFVACAVIFLGIATFKISRPWELMHDDDGAFFATVALSHLKLGLQETKAHNFQVDSKTGEILPYPNHPSGVGLLIALPVALFGPRSHAAVRMMPIFFHTISLVLLILYVRKTYGWDNALISAYVLAVIPMSSFFGRTVYFGPFLLPAMILFTLAYFGLIQGPRKAFWAVLVGLGLWGIFVDWPMYFALIACFGHALYSYLKTKKKKFIKAMFFMIFLGLFFVLLNITHLYLAFGDFGYLRVIDRVRYATHPQAHHPWTQVVGHVLEFSRRYFSEVIFLASLGYLYLKIRDLIKNKELAPKDEIILTFFAAGVLNIVLAPNYARNHHYQGFYLLPFMALAFIGGLEWLKIKYPANFKKLRTIALILMTISSAVTLKIRHTRINDYAIRASEEFKRFM